MSWAYDNSLKPQQADTTPNSQGYMYKPHQFAYKYRYLLKISPPPFLNEVVAKGAFLSKICPPIYTIVHAIMLSKKYQRSCTVQ